MERVKRIRQQVMLCKLLCESIAEEVEKALPFTDFEVQYFDKNTASPVNGYTRIDNDIIKLRRELAKLGKMTGGRLTDGNA